MVLIVFLSTLLPSVNAENSITFNTIKSYDQNKSSSSENLVAYSISGIRNTVYFAFDFSNFPSDLEPVFGVFYINSFAAIDPCTVEAFYFDSADWIQTNEVSNTTVLKSTGATNFVSQGNELYAFTSEAFIDAVKAACLEKGQFTVCLKAKQNLYSDSTVVFKPDATLMVVYSIDEPNSSPTPTVPEFSLITIPLLSIGGLVTAITYKRINGRK
jgi:hypothetical protein